MANALIPELNYYRLRNVKAETPLEKLFYFANQLKFKRHRNLEEYATILQKSVRQVRRDVTTLSKFFDLDYDEYGRPFIFTEENDDELHLHLTSDEARFLLTSVTASKKKLAISLRKKLETQLAKSLGAVELNKNDVLYSRLIEVLKDAINKSVRVSVIGYENLKSKIPYDILLEPVALSQLKYLTAFDVKNKKTKNYVISRMKNVEITLEPIQFAEVHERLTPDIFGMNIGKEFEIQLKLTHLAYTLLVEDFPQADKHIVLTESEKYPYEFISTLKGLKGVGRFILGLPGEIKIVAPKELKVYVSEKANQIK